MTTETKFATISMNMNPENGEVTLFVSDHSWGPVVTGKNLAEAKTKMKEAFGLAMIANSYCATVDAQKHDGALKAKVSEYNKEMTKLNNTLEYVL